MRNVPTMNSQIMPTIRMALHSTCRKRREKERSGKIVRFWAIRSRDEALHARSISKVKANRQKWTQERTHWKTKPSPVLTSLTGTAKLPQRKAAKMAPKKPATELAMVVRRHQPGGLATKSVQIRLILQRLPLYEFHA